MSYTSQSNLSYFFISTRVIVERGYLLDEKIMIYHQKLLFHKLPAVISNCKRWFFNYSR